MKRRILNINLQLQIRKRTKVKDVIEKICALKWNWAGHIGRMTYNEEEIVSLGKSMGLEVEERDVNELIEEYTQELTTEEIEELQSQQNTDVMQEIGFEESEEEVISTSEIKKIL